MKIDKHLELDKNLEMDKIGVEDGEDEPDELELKKPVDARDIPIGNKIDICMSNFSMSIISSNSPLSELQQIMSFYLLLHLDEAFAESWRSIQKNLIKKEEEKHGKKE